MKSKRNLMTSTGLIRGSRREIKKIRGEGVSKESKSRTCL